MNRFLALLLGIFLIGFGSLTGASNDNPFQLSIRRGINISHWLSQVSEGWYPDRKVFFSEMDVILLKRIGFDHIRIPLDEVELWDEDGHKIKSAWRSLNSSIEWCERHDLRVIVDLHVVRNQGYELFSDNGVQELYLEFWTGLMDELGHHDTDLVGYEIMIQGATDDPDDWNNMIAKVYSHVREREPSRVIIIGANMWQQIRMFPLLKVPQGDENIILSFNYFNPFFLTHYNASWTPLRAYQGPVHYPGQTVEHEDMAHYPQGMVNATKPFLTHFDASVIEDEMLVALRVAAKNGVRLYCAEWGCYQEAPREDRLRWYSDMVDVMDNLGIARANWDYKGDFGIVNPQTLDIDWELARIIMQ